MEGSGLGSSGCRAGDVITKFFVSNLLEGCTPWELRKGLEGFGAISGTYVAKKRDKEGCRFGFVSFANVSNRAELERSLKGVKLGDFKLKINIAKFALENSGGAFQPESKKGYQVPPSSDRSRLFNLRDSRSFSDVLGMSGGASKSNVEAGGSKLADCFARKVLVVPDRTLAFKELFGLAVVGRTVDLETLVDFDKLLRIAKVPFSRIQYLGGLSILVSFGNAASADKFLASRDVWNPWFSKLEASKGQSLSLERVAWLNIHGIPLHLLEADVFKQVGVQFGKVLHVPDGIEEDQDLSLVRVGVLAGEAQRINEVVSLNGKNRFFRVWVEEEKEAWLPECLASSLDSQFPSGSGSPMMSSPVGGVPVGGLGEDEELGPAGVKEGVEESPREEERSFHENIGSMHVEREIDGMGVFKEKSVEDLGGFLGHRKEFQKVFSHLSPRDLDVVVGPPLALLMGILT
ncbi:putative RNA recognition motif domain, nucleotide-binding alpha-beta plait domain superfamily [Helianthus annuus]|nr:putative RNA recognition motif domain, nucleotide-binding alpha-beta plait domain superfamily [Helianthus annuus]